MRKDLLGRRGGLCLHDLQLVKKLSSCACQLKKLTGHECVLLLAGLISISLSLGWSSDRSHLLVPLQHRVEIGVGGSNCWGFQLPLFSSYVKLLLQALF